MSTRETYPRIEPVWPEVLTPDEAARYLRVSPATLRKAVKRGDFPVIQVADRWRVSRSTLEAYMSGELTNDVGLSARSIRNIVRRGGSITK